jgi:hypothetical protein
VRHRVTVILIVIENGGAKAMKYSARIIPGSAMAGSAGVPTGNVLLALALLALVSALACAPHHHAGDDDVSADDDDNDDATPPADDDASPADDDDNDDGAPVVVFAAGSGTILGYDGSTWSQMFSDSNVNVLGLWGSSLEDVFAVGWQLGYYPAGTLVLHYDGSAWSVMKSGTLDEGMMHAVWGSGPADVFAVGTFGNIIHYNGVSWSPIDDNLYLGLGLLCGVWGSSATDVWAVGHAELDEPAQDLRTVAHYDGLAWKQVDDGPTASPSYLYGVWGSSASDVFAVGDSILHYDGASWSDIADGKITGNAVWGASPSDVFVVYTYPATPPTAYIYHYDGAFWSTMTSIPGWLNATWGLSPTDVYAVGSTLEQGGSGIILHYDGSSWSPMDNGMAPGLVAVWGPAS